MAPPTLLDFELSSTPTHTRVAVLDDLESVNVMHALCSDASRAARYLAGVPHVTPSKWARFVDRDRGTTWITQLHGQVLAVTHLLQTFNDHGDRDPSRLELAILVRDDVQGQGLGTALAQLAYAQAHTAGATAVIAYIASTNRRMAAILRSLGAQPWKVTGPYCDIVVPVGGTAA